MAKHEQHCRPEQSRDQPTCINIKGQPVVKSRSYPPEFWNALSKITLTRKALKEFERRTTEEKTTPVVEAASRSTRLLRSDTQKLLDFAKNGGPNLDHLRGYAGLPQPTAKLIKSSSRKSKRTRDSAMKLSTTGPYDPQFEQMLIDNGIFPEGYGCADDAGPPEPRNLNALQSMLSRERSSLSAFSEDDFKHFRQANRMATSESKVISSLIPIIAGVEDRHCNMEENRKFNNFKQFAPDLTVAQPDKYYGAHPSEINLSVRRDLSKCIIPSTNASLPAAPNFFFEGKSTTGRADVALRQVMYDNAYGARAMFELQNYRSSTHVYDGNAYTIGSFYHPVSGTLQFYSTHPKQSATGGTEYYMTQLGIYPMTNSAVSCRQGIAAYRNARDFAREQRDRFIANANTIARPAATNVQSPLDSSVKVSFCNAQ